MAIFKTGGGITEFRGSIAGNTYSRNRGGMVMKTRTVPVNTRSSKQQRSRSLFAYLTEAWNNQLTTDQRTAWDSYAHAVRSKNKLGESIRLSGQLHFIRSNQSRITAGLAIEKEGPTILALPESDPTLRFEFNTSETILVYFDTAQAWRSENGGAISLLVSRPQPTTKNYFTGPWVFAGVINGNSSSPPASPALITPPFPVSTNQKLFAKALEIRADGRTSNPMDLEPQTYESDLLKIFIADTHNHRIMQRKFSDMSYISKIGSLGTGDDQFNLPRRICSDDTYIYVVDTTNNRIVKRLKSDLSFVSKIGSAGPGNDQFGEPMGICINAGILYVANYDYSNIKIHRASDLSYITKFGTAGAGDNQFNGPKDVATDGTYLYIADCDNHRIKKHLLSTYAYVSKIGSQGTGDDQFNQPHSIATDGILLFVADTANSRIHKRLAADLSFVSKIGTVGSGDDQFDYPKGIRLIGDYILVPDHNNHRIVKRLKSDLSFVSKIGSQGSGNDQFYAPWHCG